MVWDILLDSIMGAVLITGIVVVMMMLFEMLNINSHGKFFSGLKKSRVGQVVLSSLLGAIPGCMGGFASVSLYTHRVFSFGALVAMMIASSGDEAFVMLAMFPQQALWITLILLVIAIVVGIAVDLVYHPVEKTTPCDDIFRVHNEDENGAASAHHFSWKRALMFIGIALFLTALVTGVLEHEEYGETPEGFTFLSEEWMYWLFGALGLIVLGALIWGSDHFVEEHLWHHIICRHLPRVFLWTFGVLVILGFGLHYLDIETWISGNTALMILLAALVGIIPESGPHLIFVTLFASGIVPLPVLLASCISQDGHASLPLLAETKKGFILAKAINCAVALAAGFASMLLINSHLL